MNVKLLPKLIVKETKFVFSNRATFVSIGIYIVLMANIFHSHAGVFKELFPQLIAITTFLLFSFTFSSQLFLSEKINNTLEFLLTTPLSFSEIVFGKTLSILFFSSAFSLLLSLIFSILNFGMGYLIRQIAFMLLLLLILNVLFFPFLNVIAVFQMIFGQTAALVFNLLFFLGFFKLKIILGIFKNFNAIAGLFVLSGIAILYFIEYYIFNKITYERLINNA